MRQLVLMSLLLALAMLTVVSVRLPLGQAMRELQDAVPTTTFHHVHLNSTNPSAATGFYTKIFDVTKKTSLAGFDAVQSENVFLLFNKVKTAPLTSPDSAIWHFGWGSTEMENDYKKHLGNGVEFATPMTRLGSGLLFAYMKAPDGALVEINTANTRAFLHTHLYSAAPICAAEWYVKHLGAMSRPTARAQTTGSCEVPFAAPSEPLGVIRSPAATVRFGDISLIIYPQQRPGKLVGPRNHVVDHIALSVVDLPGKLEQLRKAGIKVLEEPRQFGNTNIQAAMIEGPDAIAIELIEAKTL